MTSTYLAAYLACGFALLAWMTYRFAGKTAHAAFGLALLWPLTLLIICSVLLLDGIGWRLNIERRPDLSPFGLRRRDVGRGWAVRCLYLELQVWKGAQE